ncbi:hypothetical protein B0H13DRAFT_2519061 [Mycena leptocephala]|nr:hypothetical protein B0H13DRAFT_2519061 [Mycena leptocephala]
MLDWIKSLGQLSSRERYKTFAMLRSSILRLVVPCAWALLLERRKQPPALDILWRVGDLVRAFPSGPSPWAQYASTGSSGAGDHSAELTSRGEQEGRSEGMMTHLFQQPQQVHLVLIRAGAYSSDENHSQIALGLAVIFCWLEDTDAAELDTVTRVRICARCRCATAQRSKLDQRTQGSSNTTDGRARDGDELEGEGLEEKLDADGE